MRHTSDEAGLVADAEEVLGEHVLAAGTFGPQNLVVAVTPERIYVLSEDHGVDPPQLVHTFDRATTSVDVTRFGLSRILSLSDAASGSHLELHASVAPRARRRAPDEDVLAELTGNHG